jgi:hypothetical protein
MLMDRYCGMVSGTGQVRVPECIRSDMFFSAWQKQLFRAEGAGSEHFPDSIRPRLRLLLADPVRMFRAAEPEIHLGFGTRP